MKKKILLVALCAFACVALTVGCGKSGNKTPDKGETTQDINIVDSALTLDCFETYTLTAEYDGEDSVQWSSSDPSVVAVDENGLLTAGINLGTATITARAGKSVDECDVTVLLKHGLPEMRIANDVFVSEGGGYDVPCNVYYNSIDITGYLTFGCNADGENADAVATASVNGNVTTFAGVAEGKTSFTVYTTVFGRLYAEKVNVSVHNTDVVYVVNEIVDNQLQVRGDNERFTSDVEIYYNNQRVADDTLVWTVDDENVVRIGADGRLIAVMEGVTVLSTEYRGKTIGVEVRVIKDRENINVVRETPTDVNLDLDISVDTANKVRTYSVNDANTISLKIGGDTDGGVVVRGYLDGVALNVDGFIFAGGTVSMPSKAFGTDLYGEKTLVLEVEDSSVVRIYTVNVLLITKIPTSLTAFQTAVVIRWPGDRITGYFALDRDIDFNSYEISVWATDWNWDNGFRGTLDGRNHSILNVCSVMYGITAQMGDGAVFKNLKFPNLTYKGGNTALFARGAVGVTFDNIEITLTEESACTANGDVNQAGLLVSHDMRRCTFKNITINAAGKDLQRIFGGKGEEKGSCVYENVTIHAKSVKYYENDVRTAPAGVMVVTNG